MTLTCCTVELLLKKKPDPRVVEELPPEGDCFCPPLEKGFVELFKTDIPHLIKWELVTKAMRKSKFQTAVTSTFSLLRTNYAS